MKSWEFHRSVLGGVGGAIERTARCAVWLGEEREAHQGESGEPGESHTLRLVRGSVGGTSWLDRAPAAHVPEQGQERGDLGVVIENSARCLRSSPPSPPSLPTLHPPTGCCSVNIRNEFPAWPRLYYQLGFLFGADSCPPGPPLYLHSL